MKKILIPILLLIFFLVGCNNNQNIYNDVENDKSNHNFIEENSISAKNEIEITKVSTENQMPKLEEEIGKYSTKIYDKDEERQNNLQITCSKINEHIVKQGEIFSFEDIVGQATPKEGYKKAKIFDKQGNVEEGYGGGKCQVSTTLFNAVRNLPGIEIIERHDHSNKVPYAKTGDDAAVAHGGYDFKFKNINDYDIKLLASTDGENVTVSINKISK